MCGSLVFCKQKTADEMRISDLSSDVGYSDLGHLALIEEARARADHVVTSSFVNPIQFGANEDLDRYPRREASDAKLLSDRGCDVLWAQIGRASCRERVCQYV